MPAPRATGEMKKGGAGVPPPLFLSCSKASTSIPKEIGQWLVAWLVPADGEFMRYHGTIQIRKTKGGEVGGGDKGAKSARK